MEERNEGVEGQLAVLMAELRCQILRVEDNVQAVLAREDGR